MSDVDLFLDYYVKRNTFLVCLSHLVWVSVIAAVRLMQGRITHLEVGKKKKKGLFKILHFKA